MVAAPALALVAANSVNSSSIVDSSILTRDIKRNAINSSRIRDYSIRKEDIHSGSINKYKLTSNSVNTYKIEDGTIKNADISGSAAISDSKINYSIKTGYLSIPVAELSPHRGNYDYYKANFLFMYSGFGIFYAPARLPQGAVVTKLRYNFKDSSGPNDTAAKLYRFSNSNPNNTGTMALLSTVSMANSSSWRSLSIAAISDATIDNNNYAYVVEVYLSGTGVTAGNIVIEYTYTTPGR